MLAMTLSPELDRNGAAFGLPVGNLVSEGLLDRRLRTATPRLLQAREHIFFDGDPKDYVYQVEKGAVCLYKTLPDGRRQIVDFAYPGDIVGLSTLKTHVFSAQAIALTRLRCLAVGLLEEMARNDPRVGVQLYQALSDQLLSAHDLLLTVGQRNATERLAALLMALSRRNERGGADPERVALPMTRADIADFLSLTIETVSRTFTKLRQSGFIDLAHSSLVVIRDRRALGRLATGDEDGMK
ncbi:MAG: helix-turn-helix domain-containing protein [Hyphomicrobium sp.]